MTDGMGRLIGIWVKRAHGGPMEPVDQASLVEGWGVEGNALQLGKRQVTLIERESWDEMMSLLQTDADPSTRRGQPDGGRDQAGRYARADIERWLLSSAGVG